MAQGAEGEGDCAFKLRLDLPFDVVTDNDIVGGNFRMDGFQGALLNEPTETRLIRLSTPIPDIIDNAITTTMSRTVITHAMTQMMVLSMLFFGGEALHYFAVALTIGILFGIYSSVLVASPLVMWLGVSRKDLVKPDKKTEIGAAI